MFGNVDTALRANAASFDLWAKIWDGFASGGCGANAVYRLCANSMAVTSSAQNFVHVDTAALSDVIRKLDKRKKAFALDENLYH